MAANDGEVPGPSGKTNISGKSKVDLREIVNVLIEDLDLVRKWKEFYYSLQTHSSDFDQWDRSYNNTTMTIKDIFGKILSHWALAHGREATVWRLQEALVSEKFISVAETLSGQYPLSSTIVQLTAITGSNHSWTTNSELDLPISFELYKPIDSFVGRIKELEILDKLYKENTRLVVVSGLGGVGKSELVKTFGTKFLNDVQGNCIWIHGESEESFKGSIKRLANDPQISLGFESDMDPVEIFVRIYNRKLRQRPVLIVIDNVDKTNSIVDKFIRKGKHELDNLRLILVTTRNKSVLYYAGENIELEMLDSGDAVQMIINGLESRVTESDAIRLSDTLGHFPLVIQQAIAFIKQKRCRSFGRDFGVAEYLEYFDKEKTKLMDFPLNVDYSYDSTTFAVWHVIVDDIKHTNGRVGVMAADILRMLAFVDADGVYFTQFSKFYQDINIPRKGDIDIEEGKVNAGEIEEAVELLQTYSMCRVDGDNLSSHRLVRDFMLENSDHDQDQELLRKLMFLFNHMRLRLDFKNICKLGRRYRNLVREMFYEFWKLEVDDGEICSSISEIYKKNFNQALETACLEIHFLLKFFLFTNFKFLNQSLLQNCHKVYQFVRHRYGLDHELIKSIHGLIGYDIYMEAGLPVDIRSRFLVDMVDGDCVPAYILRRCFIELMVALEKEIVVATETTQVLIVLKESITNHFHLNEDDYRLVSLAAFSMISFFFKRNGDTDLFNQTQYEMSCLMEHPSDLAAAWHYVKTHLHYFSLQSEELIFQNISETVDIGAFERFYRLASAEVKKVSDLMDSISISPTQMCHLDLFATLYNTCADLKENGRVDQSYNFPSLLDSNLFNKKMVIRVIEGIKIIASGQFHLDDLETGEENGHVDQSLNISTQLDSNLWKDPNQGWLSLWTEIVSSARNSLDNNYEAIWSLAEIIKALSKYHKVFWNDVSDKTLVELIDILEGLVNTDNEKKLFKRKMYSVIHDIHHRLYEWDFRISLFLRLQKYGLNLTMLKMLLRSASSDQIVAIGNNTIKCQREGSIDKSDTFLAIKYVLSSLIRLGEKDKSLEILFKTLATEHCPSSDENLRNSLFEKIQLKFVDVDYIHMAIATFLYQMKFMDLEDPQGFLSPATMLFQILEMLSQKQPPIKLLALCYEIYHFRFRWNILHLCWTFIQILNCLVEMNKNELAERFVGRIIKKTKIHGECFWYYTACWYLVFGTYYEPQPDAVKPLDNAKVDNCVKKLEVFEMSFKN